MKRKNEKRKARRFAQRMREKGNWDNIPVGKSRRQPEQPKELSMEELEKRIFGKE